MPPFAQSLRQIQILILEILNVFLWLKFSFSLTLDKIERFSKVSLAAFLIELQPPSIAGYEGLWGAG